MSSAPLKSKNKIQIDGSDTLEKRNRYKNCRSKNKKNNYLQKKRKIEKAKRISKKNNKAEKKRNEYINLNLRKISVEEDNSDDEDSENDAIKLDEIITTNSEDVKINEEKNDFEEKDYTDEEENNNEEDNNDEEEEKENGRENNIDEEEKEELETEVQKQEEKEENNDEEEKDEFENKKKFGKKRKIEEKKKKPISNLRNQNNNKNLEEISSEKKLSESKNEKYKIYFANLNYKCNEEQLKNFFKKCGNIEGLKIKKKNDGKSTGKGYIIFSKKESMHNSLKKNGEKFCGRKIIIKKYESNKSRILNRINVLESEFNRTKIELKNLKKEMKKEKAETNKKIGLLIEIQNKSDQYHNINYKNTNYKINALINSYRILYVRKFSNFILDALIKKYKKYLSKTKKEFISDRYPFRLIVADKNINGISKYQINLIFDFLMEVKQNTSNIIHLGNKEIIIQKEIFMELIMKNEKVSKNEKNNLTIGIEDMVSVIFGNKVESDGKQKTKLSRPHKKIIEAIKKYIEEEEEEEEEEKKNDQKSSDENESEEELENVDEKKKNTNTKKENIIDIASYLKSSKNEYKDLENEESSNQSEEDLERIQNIMSGDDNTQSDAKIKSLLKNLCDRLTKIYSIKNYITNYRNVEIDPVYFYNLWKDSFDKENYKSDKDYTYFIKKEKIISLEEMGDILKKLLKDIKYNLFDDDPSKFESRIKKIIDHY